MKFTRAQGQYAVRLRVDTIEDLWSMQRVLLAGDLVKSESKRRFRSHEGDIGELKDVVIRLRVERTELDKNAQRLRVMGKIVEGLPAEYVKLNSYHTLNVAPGDQVEITKQRWPDYMIQVLRNAVSDSRRPRLGIILVDDEKALPAMLLGYGVRFESEMYSNLSKRMSQKDFTEQQRKYFEAVAQAALRMDVETVLIAGPGFTKDDIKLFIQDSGLAKGSSKKLVFASASNTERSGAYELIRSDEVARLLEAEQIRREFKLMDAFLGSIPLGKSSYGAEAVSNAVRNYEASVVMVNDSVLGDPAVQAALEAAEASHVRIEVFNSDDEVGVQLRSFKDIACMP